MKQYSDQIFTSARWISCPDAGAVNAYSEFLENVEIPAGAAPVVLTVSAHTDYCLYEGETPILPASGQFDDYPCLPTVDRVDLTGVLASGRHQLRFVLYTCGQEFSTSRPDVPGIIYELRAGDRILCASGPETLCAPDPYYLSGDMEHVSGQLGYTFRYIADQPEAAHKKAKPADKSMNFQLRPIRKLCILPPMDAAVVDAGTFTETNSQSLGRRVYCAALASSHPAPVTLNGAADMALQADGGDGCYLIADVGAETAGLLALELTVPCDCEVVVGWGEHLVDGKCETSPAGRVRAQIHNRNFAASVRLRKGFNRFVCPFLRLGARYLEAHIYAPEASVTRVTLLPTVYPLDQITRFRCDDETYNRIYDISLRTLRLCMHEHYEDCAWREQSLYAMDSRNQMLCGYYAFGETRFALASLVLMADSLRKDGLLELCSPAYVSVDIPAFSAIFLTQAAEYLDYSGDLEGTARIFPAMCTVADTFLRRIDPANGLLTRFDPEHYWNFYEWQDGLDGDKHSLLPGTTYDAPLNAFVSMGFRSLARVAAALGDDALAAKMRTAHESLNAAMDRTFFDETQGAYASYLTDGGERVHFCELTNALALFCGAATGAHGDRAAARLLAGDLIPVSLSHSIFKYDVLLARGEYRAVFDEVRRKWSAMLDAGATSFWETEDGAAAFDDAGSLCHGWSAAPAYLLLRYALYADPAETGLTGCRAETIADDWQI